MHARRSLARPITDVNGPSTRLKMPHIVPGILSLRWLAGGVEINLPGFTLGCGCNEEEHDLLHHTALATAGRYYLVHSPG